MNRYSDKDDKLLVEMTLLGVEDAYEALVRRHQRAVMGTAYKVDGEPLFRGGRFAGCLRFGLDEPFRTA